MGKPFPPEAIPLLGKYPDEQVAKMVNRPKSSVSYNRRKLGIEACLPRMARPQKKPEVDPEPCSNDGPVLDLATLTPYEAAHLLLMEARADVLAARKANSFTAVNLAGRREADALTAFRAEAEKVDDQPEEAAPEVWLEDLRKYAESIPRTFVAQAVEVLQQVLRPKPLGVIEGGKEEATG